MEGSDGSVAESQQRARNGMSQRHARAHIIGQVKHGLEALRDQAAEGTEHGEGEGTIKRLKIPRNKPNATSGLLHIETQKALDTKRSPGNLKTRCRHGTK